MPLNELHPFLHLNNHGRVVKKCVVSMPLNGLHPFLLTIYDSVLADMECINALKRASSISTPDRGYDIGLGIMYQCP